MVSLRGFLKPSTCEEIELREKVIKVLEEQGFKVGSHIRPIDDSKTVYRQIHQKSKFEKLALHKQFLIKHFEKAKSFCRNGYEIVPENISLELREVKPGSLEEILFKWWNLIWWSIPFERAYGRQMKFLLWDKTHNAPFGLISLQSPVLKMAVRDKYLNLPKEELDIWVNMSMNAQRVGALPPYNDLLGGKMVALALTCNEIREAYKQKYNGRITILSKRTLKPELLFITTTSAFGKSS
ncbi:MAG: Druantia anti-phage system protein DruA, partial [Hydrogenobacter sp.]